MRAYCNEEHRDPIMGLAMTTQPFNIPVRHKEITLFVRWDYFSPEEIELRCTAMNVVDASPLEQSAQKNYLVVGFIFVVNNMYT